MMTNPRKKCKLVNTINWRALYFITCTNKNTSEKNLQLQLFAFDRFNHKVSIFGMIKIGIRLIIT